MCLPKVLPMSLHPAHPGPLPFGRGEGKASPAYCAQAGSGAQWPKNLVSGESLPAASAPIPEKVATVPAGIPAVGTPAPLRASPTKERSFEMRLGTYWLVRIGIVMLLTGLVFFGNYAYQNYIGKLRAGGKV